MEDRPVALKLERTDAPFSILNKEYRIYLRMQEVIGIPRVVCYLPDAVHIPICLPKRSTNVEANIVNDALIAERNSASRSDDENENARSFISYNVMVMELMGKSLESLFRSCKRKFSLKTVLMLADQMLTRLEAFHDADFVHRDVKPENFMMGYSGENDALVYLIDFGLAKRYRTFHIKKTSNPVLDEHRSVHIPYEGMKKLTGTPRYASVNTHLGIEQSRRDDLESLGYVLVYFLRGNLPWQAVEGENIGEKYANIQKCKTSTCISDLCYGLPAEFFEYFCYCKHLFFEDRPNYSLLRVLFRRLFRKSGYSWDFVYDWDDIRRAEKRKL